MQDEDNRSDQNLFANSYQSNRAPLPHRLRPHQWSELAGHSSLADILKKRETHSMILYGPPGCGKTTLARIYAENSGLEFYSLSAVSSGIKEVREIIEKGRQEQRMGRSILLFIDEIHRFNKAQQDALLEAVESGWILLIGATTENPSFEVIGPLLSRCQVYRLHALTNESLTFILDRAFKIEPSLHHCEIEPDAKNILIESSGGDARKMLRILEVIALERTESSSFNEVKDTKNDVLKVKRTIHADELKDILENVLRHYDRAGENHYDFISAFIKSLRGSDPDAALLYLACMIDGGEDPIFIARRMVIFASEDIGNASPQALSLAIACFQAMERIGMPEGRIPLAQCATFLASAPKSNAAYLAINNALAEVKGKRVTIPNHLRNAPTITHIKEGAGKNYRYPHDYPAHFVREKYLPDGWENSFFYKPDGMGQESKILDRLRELWPERFKDS